MASGRVFCCSASTLKEKILFAFLAILNERNCATKVKTKPSGRLFFYLNCYNGDFNTFFGGLFVSFVESADAFKGEDKQRTVKVVTKFGSTLVGSWKQEGTEICIDRLGKAWSTWSTCSSRVETLEAKTPETPETPSRTSFKKTPHKTYIETEAGLEQTIFVKLSAKTRNVLFQFLGRLFGRQKSMSSICVGKTGEIEIEIRIEIERSLKVEEKPRNRKVAVGKRSIKETYFQMKLRNSQVDVRAVV